MLKRNLSRHRTTRALAAGIWLMVPLSGHAQTPYWGDIEQGSCVDMKTRKVYSRLWDIPTGKSWDEACKETSVDLTGFAVVPDSLTCVDKAVEGMWGEWLVLDQSCPHWDAFTPGECVSTEKRKYSAILRDIPEISMSGDGYSGTTTASLWDYVCKQTGATINGQSFSAPLRCVESNGMWGEWEVADPYCASTTKLPISTDQGSTNATGSIAAASSGPVYGMADLHAHMFNNLGFGEVTIAGSPYSTAGMGDALQHCSVMHGEGGLLDLNGAFVNGEYTHLEGGFPEFDGWPEQSNANHQTMYYKWVERAYLGGMRLMVMMAGNNELLCQINTKAHLYTDSETRCDDMSAVDRQIEATQALEAFIDSQSGGDGQGWFRIATSAAQARDIIESGKMAVVLGAEVDTLFGCGVGQSCDSLTAQLDEYQRAGLRHIFLVGHIDNGFGGTALYNPLFNAANIKKTGEKHGVVDCSTGAGRPGFGFNIDMGLTRLEYAAVEALLRMHSTGLSLPSPYSAYAGGHCNALGLSLAGENAVDEAMRRGMIIDVDHMGALTVDAVLDRVEARGYPVVAGHSGMIDLVPHAAKSEALKRAEDIQRIHALGGVVAPFFPAVDQDDTCGSSSKGFLEVYRYMIDQTGGTASAAVPFGSDFNGLVHQASPRHGDQGCPEEADRQNPIDYTSLMSHDGQVSFDRLQAGLRVYDYNVDGLANVGLLPDFVQDLKNIGTTDEELEPLFRGAEAYLRSWERMEFVSELPVSSPAGYERLSGTVPWASASQHCSAQGKRLCSQQELCPNGSANVPVLGQPEGDIWAAVGDHENAWISVGQSYPERMCRLHEELGAAPAWGTTTGPEAVTGNPAALVCCGYERPAAPLTWEAADSHCASRGETLCKKDQICSGSSPDLGSLAGDVWMAVGDHENAWISVGEAYPERMCNLHEELGAAPAWGTTTGPEAVTGVAGAMMCCAP